MKTATRLHDWIALGLENRTRFESYDVVEKVLALGNSRDDVGANEPAEPFIKIVRRTMHANYEEG